MASSYTFAINAFAHWPVDWTIIGAFAILVALETIRSGANRACSLGLALPLALLVFQCLPAAAVLGPAMQQLQAPLVQSGIFLALLLVAYVFAHRIVGFYADSSGRPLQAFVAGCATAVLLTVFWLQVPSLTSIWHFGPQIETIFGEAYRFWWLTGSYFVLAFVRS